MKKHRAIPEGYMTVGEVAKKMDVTVRTLQYYDKEGLLSPSSVSEGGRRLYKNRDIIELHQILSLKHLGFSLEDIKSRLIPLDTPMDIANVLSEQSAAIQKKIDSLSDLLRELELLRREVLQMQSVDFKRYADIIVNLQMKNEYYWMIKNFDDQTLDLIRSRFDKDSADAFMQAFMRLQKDATRFQKEGVSVESEKAQTFAKDYWGLILEFTGGDKDMISALAAFGQTEDSDLKWREQQDLANAFIQPALEFYFSKSGTNPFGEEAK